MLWPLGVLYVLTFLVIGLIHYWVYRWKNPRCIGKLPPGSMGLPLIGETLGLLTRSKSLDIHPFIKTRTEKYGKIFKTSLAGRPVVVCADPEFNYQILQQEGKLVELWYLDSFAKLMDVRGMGREGGPPPITAVGQIHKIMRNVVLNHVGSGALQERILPQIEETCREALLAWSNQDSFDVKKETSSMLFDFSVKHLYGLEPDKNMKEMFASVVEGLLLFPLNIPGTVYHKCLKKRKMGLQLLKDLLKERRAMPEKHRGDFIDQILNMMNTESQSFLTDDFAVFVMFAVLFASFEPPSSTLTVAILLLTEHPMVLKELEKEHEELIRNREKGEDRVTWKEYKSMTFTMQVVNEVLRMGSISSGFLRRAIKDIHYNGYTIPEGWTILISQMSIQLNPEMYEDPLSFNPWRWKDLGPSFMARNFTPFGGGGRMCAGSEYTKAFMAIFLHILVSNYRFEKVKGGDIVRSPILGFEDGFHIKIHDRNQVRAT